MGSNMSGFVNGFTTQSVHQPPLNNNNSNRSSRWARNRRLRSRIRRGRRSGHAKSSGLLSVDPDSGLPDKENVFRYPPTDANAPFLAGTFLLGGERHERPTMTSTPLGDSAYAFGDNHDVNFLAGKCNTVNLPNTLQDLASLSAPLRALINIRRDSVRLVKNKLPPGEAVHSNYCYNVEFTFDALVRCGITVYYFCQETNNDAGGMRFISHPKAKKFASRQYVYQAGCSQRFYHPEHVLDVNDMKMFSTFAEKRQVPSSDNSTSQNANNNSNNSKRGSNREENRGAVQQRESAAVELVGSDATTIDTTHYIPMAIHCVALTNADNANDTNAAAARQSHATFLFIERSSNDDAVATSAERANNNSSELLLKFVKQKVWIGGASFLLQEVFGIENKAASAPPPPPPVPIDSAAAVRHDDIVRRVDDDAVGGGGSDGVNDVVGGNDDQASDAEDENGADDDDDDDELDDEDESGNDCVICLSEARDTVILPCRHLCICSRCAESLRYQANNCPICRAPFKYLLQLRAYVRQQQQNAENDESQLQQQLPAAAAADSTTNRRASNIIIIAPVVAAPAPATAVTALGGGTGGERQPSLVPGDSDADDDDDDETGVELGKKKARDRVEPPTFAGYTTCVLIDTLNGTKQAHDALRAQHQQQQQHQTSSSSTVMPIIKEKFPTASVWSAGGQQQQRGVRNSTVVESDYAAKTTTISPLGQLLQQQHESTSEAVYADDTHVTITSEHVAGGDGSGGAVAATWSLGRRRRPAQQNLGSNEFSISSGEDDDNDDEITKCKVDGDLSGAGEDGHDGGGSGGVLSTNASSRTGSGHSTVELLGGGGDGGNHKSHGDK